MSTGIEYHLALLQTSFIPIYELEKKSISNTNITFTNHQLNVVLNEYNFI